MRERPFLFLHVVSDLVRDHVGLSELTFSAQATELLKEREIEDMIEVLEIDEIAEAVRLAINGTILIIGF